MSNHVIMLIEGVDQRVTTRCYMLSHWDNVLKACVLVGPFQKVKATYAALVTNSKTTVAVGHSHNYMERDSDFGYRCQYVHLPGRYAIAHIRSLDPRLLWVDGDDGVGEMLARKQFNVPFLPEWVPAIAAELKRLRLLVKLEGYSARGQMLTADSNALDKVITAGVASGALPMPTGAGTKPLSQLATIEDYVNKFSRELGAKVEAAMAPVHNPAKDAPHPLLGKMPTKLFPPQAHVSTAAAKVLRKKKFVFLACNMGTGKTPMGIVAAHLCAADLGLTGYRHLIACPPHLVEKWEREAKRWLAVPLPGATAPTRVEIIQDWRHFLALRTRPVPKGPEVYIIAMSKAKLSYHRRGAAAPGKAVIQYEGKGKKFRVDRLTCPCCATAVVTKKGEPATTEDMNKKLLFCQARLCPACRKTWDPGIERCPVCETATRICNEALWQADMRVRKISPADYGRKRMRNFFDFFTRDEAHGSKGQDSLDGNACSAMMKMSRRVILMTGTFLAGKAEDLRPLLFKSLPHLFVPRGFGWKDELPFAQRYGRVDTIARETEYKEGSEDRKGGRGSNKSVNQCVRPGIMPGIFADFCAEHVAFLSLHEMSSNLPTYSEHCLPTAMEPAMQADYDEMRQKLATTFGSLYMQDRKMAMKLLGPMLEVLLTWPDDPTGWAPIILTDEKSGRVYPVLCPPTYDTGMLLAKEEALLEMVKAERAMGRKCWIYTVRDRTAARLYKHLSSAGFRVAHLKSAVDPLKREQWIRTNALECDVGLCHPELVETGLELFDPREPRFNFPTLVWYSTGYKLNTLRQASRRVWRIGQTRQCKTNYLYYGDTAQQEAIALMGKKLISAEAIEGKFSDGGLVDEGGGDDLALAIAKNLANGIKSHVVQTWKPVAGLQTEGERRQSILDRIASIRNLVRAKT